MTKSNIGLALWKKIFFGFVAASVVATWVFWPEEIKRTPDIVVKYDIKFLNASKKRAKAEVKKMSLEEKMGQLIVVKSDSTIDTNQIKSWVQDYYIGGICFSGISAQKVAFLSNFAQKIAKRPLLLTSDGPFKGSITLPKDLSLLSIRDNTVAADYMNQEIEDCKKTGLNLVFTPHLSLDTTRDKYSGYALFDQPDSALNKMKQWSLACDKNLMLSGIPAFDQTFVYDTSKSVAQYRDISASLFKSGMPCIKLNMSHIDKPEEVKKRLAERLGFHGLIFAEGDTNIPGKQVDILMTATRMVEVFETLKKQFQGKKSIDQLNASVIKVLQAKKWMKLKKKKPVATDLLEYEFEGNARKALTRKFRQHGMILVKDPNKVFPINRIWGQSLYVTSIGENRNWMFTHRCRSYHPAWGQDHKLNKDGSIPPLKVSQLKRYNPQLITLNGIEIDSARDKEFLASYRALTQETKVIVVNFGAIHNLDHLNAKAALLHVHETDKESMDLACQAVFGAIPVDGQLPVDIGDSLKAGTGIVMDKTTRLKYAYPEELGIHSDSLNKIDAIARECIRYRAAPGCQVFVAYKGNIVFNRAYGYHTYDRKEKVKNGDIYDLSSVTKVFSTTLAAMDLYDRKELDIEKNLKKYFRKEMDTLRGCKIKNILIKDLLLHKSGLMSYMPIVKYLQDEDSLFKKFDRYFCTEKSRWFDIEMGEDLYLRKDVPDSIWMAMKTVRVRNDHKYIYSDLNFNIIQKLIEHITEKSLDRYVHKKIYVPLGLQRTTYNPLRKFDEDIIVPTEKDRKWRKDLVHGYVHDQSAALLGGVAGNAGLFSNAHDLGVMGQMLLNGGTYGGKRFFKTETVKKFTEKAETSHRGLGFNKPVAPKMKFVAKSASINSYGHTGFAGTCVWVDPENEIVFVFLSNRIHPKWNNWKLNSYKIRSRVHQVIYDCLGIKPVSEPDEEEEIEPSDSLEVSEDLKTDA